MDVHHAVTAVYPKIRLRARDLIEAAIEWTRTLYKAVAEPLVETRFELGGEYIRAAVAEQWLPPDRAVRFARDAHLSRYVGVVSLSTDDGKRLIDILVDATDIRRAGDFHRVLALVPFSDPMTEFVTALQPNFPNLNRALIA